MKTHFKKSGWITSIVFAVVVIATLIAIDWHYNSLTSTVIRFFPYFISYSVIYFWIAVNNSRKGT